MHDEDYLSLFGEFNWTVAVRVYNTYVPSLLLVVSDINKRGDEQSLILIGIVGY